MNLIAEHATALLCLAGMGLFTLLMALGESAWRVARNHRQLQRNLATSCANRRAQLLYQARLYHHKPVVA